MKNAALLVFLIAVQTVQRIPIVKRGNIFQQLMFLSGLALNEQFYKAVLRILFICGDLFIRRVVNSAIHPETNCTHVLVCTRTEFCNEVCETGTVQVDPWLQFATRTQSSLSLLRGFCYHQSVGTHNSAITSTYGYGAEDKYYSIILSASYLQFNEVRTVSQYYSLTDQLNMGVRHIELDIHFFHNHLRISHCGFSVGIVNYLFHFMEKALQLFRFRYDTETMGCMPSFNGIPSGSVCRLL